MKVCSNKSRVLGIHHYVRGYQTRTGKPEAFINIERPRDKKTSVSVPRHDKMAQSEAKY